MVVQNVMICCCRSGHTWLHWKLWSPYYQL